MAVLSGTAYTVDAYLESRSSPVYAGQPRVCRPLPVRLEERREQPCHCPHALLRGVAEGAGRRAS